MSRLKIKARGMSFEATGEDEFISREREAFFMFADKCKDISLNVHAIPVGVGELSEEVAKNLADSMGEMLHMDMSVKEEKDSGSCTLAFIGHAKKSWGEIAEDIKAGNTLHIGDTVSCALADGTTADFVVTDSTDEYVRFESRDCIGGYVSWNDNNTNEGGYPESNVRKYVDENIWNLLPEDLRSVISETTRKWKDKDGNEDTYTTKLFLPAASEVFDEDSCYGDEGLYEQLEWYKSRKNRIRCDEDDDTCTWWLASVRSGNSAYACHVTSYGACQLLERF